MKIRENPALAVSTVPVAASLLARRHKQLRKRARNLIELGSNERHALRIAAKKLRYYTAEFFESLFPPLLLPETMLCLTSVEGRPPAHANNVGFQED